MELVQTTFYNEEAERTVLGAVLLDPSIFPNIQLKKEHFYKAWHQNLFATMQLMHSRGKDLDLISIAHVLGSKIEGVGGLTYLTELSGVAFNSSTHKEERIIVDLYKRREQYAIAQRMMQEAMDGEPTELSSKIINELQTLDDENNIDDEDDGHISKLMARVATWAEEDHGDFTGAKVGFRDLDNMLNGFQKKELTIIGARPSLGKTALAVNMVQNYALNARTGTGGPAVVFSIEMGDESLASRMLSSSSHIKGDCMKNPRKNFSENEWVKMYSSMGELSQAPLHIFDKSYVDMNYIRRKSKMIAEKYPGEQLLIVIDYMQLIKGDPIYKGNKNAEMTAISEGLKAIAKDLDANVIALSQLSRGVEQRQDKRPMLSDLRDSGGIEQA